VTGSTRKCAAPGCTEPVAQNATGRPRLYCSAACRQRAARRRNRTKPYFLTGTPEWGTAPELFAELDAEFGFTLDVCATADNAKCASYFTKADDALVKPWRGVCWMNPPYGRRDGRDLGQWVAKAYDSAQAGATVVCLLPARTDTAWWHEFTPLGEVRYRRGRERFTGGNGSLNAAPFPSVLLIFRHGFRNASSRDETRDETPGR
jgi:phage N-6-adenine-methyltransferase